MQRFCRLIVVLALALPSAACILETSPGPGTRVRGGGATTVSTARSSRQHSGSTVVTYVNRGAVVYGPTYQDTLCDGSSEDTAYCDTATSVTFCENGNWYHLDCTVYNPNGFCAEDSSTLVVDCYSE